MRFPFGTSVLWLALAATALASGPAPPAETKDPYETLEAVGLGSDLKQGYALRSDSWAGDLPVDGVKRIEYTLFRGNDYHFYAYATTRGAKISFHIQNREGAVVEARSWQKEIAGRCFAGADIVPAGTGAFFLVVKVEQSPAERTEWSLVFAYR